VTYADATDYTAWISRRTGKRYRLPTEAEWEYAARGGTDTPRFWGTNSADACRYANVFDTTAAKGVSYKWTPHACSDGHVFTAPVGSFKPNPFGLYDMIGNVWQWTADCWRDTYDSKPQEVASLTGPACSFRALRGGSWMSDPANARVSARMRNDGEDADTNIGFRVVRDAQ